MSQVYGDLVVYKLNFDNYKRARRDDAFANILIGIRSQNLLGSSNFPFLGQTYNSLLQNSFAFENTFATYSKLALTHLEDRPVAILGLAKRLEKHYKTTIIYGIVHCYLHKSLLWQRVSRQRMVRSGAGTN